MTVASFVISCVAVLAAIGAAWYGRGQKRAAEQSAVEAKRSADAAAEVTRIEQQRRAEEVTEADRRRVMFELVFHKGNSYLLRNEGTDSAYGVHVDTQGLVPQGDLDFDPPVRRTSILFPEPWVVLITSS
jgi:type II secretory pathway pseudopilin PulG